MAAESVYCYRTHLLCFRRAHQCSEILSLNNVEITSAIVNNETACEMLLNYLNGRQINYVLAGFYMKILTQLVSRQLDEVCKILRFDNK